jgi:type I restriction enzyme S subunit
MKTVALGDLVAIQTGKLDANASSPDGVYPFFTCAREPLRISSWQYDLDAILIAGNGDLNVKHYKGKFDAYQRTYILSAKNDRVDTRYLYHFLDKYLDRLREQSIGGIIKYIKLGMLTDAEIPLPPLEEQKRIAAILDQADELRRKRQCALDRLNQLGQAIFIEMFGDPASNPMGWPKVPLADCCAEPDDIRCGPFGTQLLREEFQEAGVPLWGIKQVNRAFSIPTHEYVTPSKAKELSNYDVVADDIVMTRKGTIGNCAVYPQSFPPGVMHSDLLRVRLDRAKAAPQFIADQLHYSRDVERQIELISGGAIMQGINVGKLKRIGVLLPPLSLQARYAARMTEVGLQVSAMKSWLGRGGALFDAIQHRAFRGEPTTSSPKEAAA